MTTTSQAQALREEYAEFYPLLTTVARRRLKFEDGGEPQDVENLVSEAIAIGMEKYTTYARYLMLSPRERAIRVVRNAALTVRHGATLAASRAPRTVSVDAADGVAAPENTPSWFDEVRGTLASNGASDEDLLIVDCLSSGMDHTQTRKLVSRVGNEMDKVHYEMHLSWIANELDKLIPIVQFWSTECDPELLVVAPSRPAPPDLRPIPPIRYATPKMLCDAVVNGMSVVDVAELEIAPTDEDGVYRMDVEGMIQVRPAVTVTRREWYSTRLR
jgi:hypothetical protein